MTDTQVDAGAFAVSPDLAATAFTQITQRRDVVGEMVRCSAGRCHSAGATPSRSALSWPVTARSGSAASQLIRFGQEVDKPNISKAL
jgi:predicted CxxxxCH...CXXCH cytochrome family protein